MTIATAAEQFNNMCLEDALLTLVAFGKHTGKPMAEIPYKYIEWISRSVRPADEGSRAVYRMIFAARTITEELQLPESMPKEKKFNASPRDIMRYDSNKLSVRYMKEKVKGVWIIPDAK